MVDMVVADNDDDNDDDIADGRRIRRGRSVDARPARRTRRANGQP